MAGRYSNKKRQIHIKPKRKQKKIDTDNWSIYAKKWYHYK